MKHNLCRSGVLILSAIVFAATFISIADATLISFEPKNDSTNATYLGVAGQLQMNVIDSGGGTVTFQFTNIGSLPSVVTQIGFFSDQNIPDLFDLSDIAYEPETGTQPRIVSFETDNQGPLGPANGFNTPSNYNLLLIADAESPSPFNGVGIGVTPEQLDIIIGLADMVSFGDVISAMTGSGNDEFSKLFVGLHVQAMQDVANGASDSYYFISTPLDPMPGQSVPAPPTVVLVASGMLGFLGYKWRKGSTESEAS